MLCDGEGEGDGDGLWVQGSSVPDHVCPEGVLGLPLELPEGSVGEVDASVSEEGSMASW